MDELTLKLLEEKRIAIFKDFYKFLEDDTLKDFDAKIHTIASKINEDNPLFMKIEIELRNTLNDKRFFVDLNINIDTYEYKRYFKQLISEILKHTHEKTKISANDMIKNFKLNLLDRVVTVRCKKYKITSMNYVTNQENRKFVNMQFEILEVETCEKIILPIRVFVIQYDSDETLSLLLSELEVFIDEKISRFDELVSNKRINITNR